MPPICAAEVDPILVPKFELGSVYMENVPNFWSL
jgi:hypothetical protein